MKIVPPQTCLKGITYFLVKKTKGILSIVNKLIIESGKFLFFNLKIVNSLKNYNVCN